MNTVFAVMRNSDFTEGRGTMILDAVFSNAEAAIKYANSIEPYGASVVVGKYKSSYAYGQFMEIKAFTVYDEFVDVKAKKDEEARKKAISKLSAEDRRVLGLL